jgi:uncharacterized protein (DUF488 family)
VSDDVIFTVGHSVRSFDDFVQLLHAHEITGLADVRTVPRSRRHPHFSRESLQASLPAEGIAYRHFGLLGGLRKPRRDSMNGAWRNESFRGYADHMQSEDFRQGIAALRSFAMEHRVAVMCAEAKWWQCHRQLIADALVALGANVRHIMSGGDAPSHNLTPFARIHAGQVTYPALC